MNIFSLWAENCQKCGIEIWKLEGDADSGLYETKESYTENNKKYYREPVYHVWKGGKWLLATLNYVEALEKWRKHNNG